MDRTLHDAFAGTARDVTEENIQARIRGNLLMALSNKRQRAAADDRQQVGARGRLLHAVRRHVRRSRRDRRRAEDDGVPRRAMAERDTPAGRSFPRRFSRRRRRRSCARTRPIRTRCRRTTCSTRSFSATSSGTSRPSRSSRRDSTRRPSTACLRLVRGAEFKRKQAAPGLKVTDRAFGTGWRMPIAAQS